MLQLKGRTVLAKPLIQDTSGSFHLHTATQDYSGQAEVLAVGATRLVRPGDRVVYGKYAFEPHGEAVIIQEDDILAVIKEDE